MYQLYSSHWSGMTKVKALSMWKILCLSCSNSTKRGFFWWIIYVISVLFLLCLRVRLFFMPCGHLLGKGWLLGSRLWCLIEKLSLSHWYPGSGIDSRSCPLSYFHAHDKGHNSVVALIQLMLNLAPFFDIHTVHVPFGNIRRYQCNGIIK